MNTTEDSIPRNFYNVVSHRHIPNLSYADDGFGQLHWVETDTWAYNVHLSYY